MPVPKLDEIVAEFADLESRERLELLLEFAENLPPLPAKYEADRDAGLHRIAECQTPEEVSSTSENLLQRLGLLESLGMIRMRGLAAVQHYIREQVRRAAASNI